MDSIGPTISTVGSPCPYCDKKSFATNQKLREHIMTHTGEKPYPCNICKRAFAQKVALRSHQRTHTGEKPFLCDVCDKRFRRRDTLTQHKIAIHSEMKPHECNDSRCRKKFSTWAGISRHCSEHQSLHQCEICLRQFARKANLASHMKNKHTSQNLEEENSNDLDDPEQCPQSLSGYLQVEVSEDSGFIDQTLEEEEPESSSGVRAIEDSE